MVFKAEAGLVEGAGLVFGEALFDEGPEFVVGLEAFLHAFGELDFFVLVGKLVSLPINQLGKG